MADISSETILPALAATIRARRAATVETSYTRRLLDGGPERCARKLGEEAIETVIAAVGEDREALTREAADLLYHLLVLLEARDVRLDAVLHELSDRAGTSGLAEKAARSNGE